MMADDVRVFSAPGKVILHGEHSVVYGESAIACAVDLRTIVVMGNASERRLVLVTDSVWVNQSWESWDISHIESLIQPYYSLDKDVIFDIMMPLHESLVKELTTLATRADGTKDPSSLAFLALYCAMSIHTQKTPAVSLTFQTQSVVGAGLGSSASYCVCLSAALLQLFGLIPPAEVAICKPSDNMSKINQSYDMDLHNVRGWDELFEYATKFTKLNDRRQKSCDSVSEACERVSKISKLSDDAGESLDNVHNKQDVNDQNSENYEIQSDKCRGKQDLSNCSTANSSPIFTWTDEHKCLINKLAFQGEVMIHGRPSGIDNSVTTYGGAVKFKKGDLTLLKHIPQLSILISNTNVERSTKVLVEKVAQRLKQYPTIIKPVMESLGGLAEESVSVLERLADSYSEEDFAKEKGLVDMNHHLLCTLGVSHPTIDDIITTTRKYGFHSKLTGAGGGGCVFTLLDRDTTSEMITSLQEDLRHKGYHSWHTQLGAKGVCQHFGSELNDL